MTSRPVTLFHFYCPVDFDALRFGQMRHERVAAQHQQLAKVPVVSVHNLTRNFQKMSLKKQQDSPSLSILLPQIWFVCLCVPEPTGLTDERKRVSFPGLVCHQWVGDLFRVAKAINVHLLCRENTHTQAGPVTVITIDTTQQCNQHHQQEAKNRVTTSCVPF